MAGKPSARGGTNRGAVTIVIRRDEGEEPAHHGGAWKVAYADFVTAMMAFFLLMWLLNATTEEQRTGLADYFAPTNLFGRAASGSGQPFGGKTPNDAGTSVSTSGSPRITYQQQPPQPEADDEDVDTQARPSIRTDTAREAADVHDSGLTQAAGQSTSPVQDGDGAQALVQGGDYAAPRVAPPTTQDTQADAKAQAQAQAQARRDDAARERQALERAGAQMVDAVKRDPDLQDVAGQLTVETVPEGLRIQVVDAERRQMFALGSAVPNPRVRDLMQKVVPVLATLPNAISIAGHTDARTYRGQEKGNWELSADRANATRRILVDAGLPEERIRSVTGNADRDLLVPSDPLSPVNRRITIIVLRHAGAARERTP